MLKLFAAIFLVGMVLASDSFGQACGGGKYQIALNTKEPVHYKLFPLTPKDATYDDERTKKHMGGSFFPYESSEKLSWNSPLKVDTLTAEVFLAGYLVENYEPVYRNLETEGSSVGGLITIPTAEAYSAPFLLKLTSSGFNTAYYIGSFLGGCKTKKTFSLQAAGNLD